ncbi:type II secretion system protein [Patescibacteria group bacterium]|nr:MAG: type II secretion system protein [Patescibacteria group bacterium]
MVSLKQRQSGFTIVELLIVIVIIGILATLVIVTFSGVQQKARDSERKTDINAIAGQLEAVYASKGFYPTGREVNNGSGNETWRSDNEFRIDAKAFADPKDADATNLTVGASSASSSPTGTFTYYYTPLTDTDTVCTTSGDCVGYVLYANMEATKDPTQVYSRQSSTD